MKLKFELTLDETLLALRGIGCKIDKLETSLKSEHISPEDKIKETKELAQYNELHEKILEATR